MLIPVVELKQVSQGISSHHPGIDLAAPYGSPVRAALTGTVAFAGWYYGYGRMVDIRHGDGILTRYAHLSAFSPGLQEGADVATGEIIGAIGTSGHAHGAHLHFEVRLAGQVVDPAPFVSLASCSAMPSEERLQVARASARAQSDETLVASAPFVTRIPFVTPRTVTYRAALHGSGLPTARGAARGLSTHSVARTMPSTPVRIASASGRGTSAANTRVAVATPRAAPKSERQGKDTRGSSSPPSRGRVSGVLTHG